jgi:hypothetical protein
MAKSSTTFKKGQVTNPAGRPKKGECLTEILREIGDLKDIKTKDALMDRKTALCQKLWQMALFGDFPVMKYVFDRLDPQTNGIFSGMAAPIDSEVTIKIVKSDKTDNDA